MIFHQFPVRAVVNQANFGFLRFSDIGVTCSIDINRLFSVVRQHLTRVRMQNYGLLSQTCGEDQALQTSPANANLLIDAGTQFPCKFV